MSQTKPIVIQPRLDPTLVAAALGGEFVASRSPGLGPMSLFATRMSAMGQIAAGGGPKADPLALRPTEGERRILEQVAVAASGPGFTPSPEQVAEAILSMALQSASAAPAELGRLVMARLLSRPAPSVAAS